MIPVVLPAQYLVEAGRYLAEPQKRLMLAVLQTAVDDYQGSPAEQASHRGGSLEEKAAKRAAAYVSSRDRSWPFSFESICETVGLDAERLRRGLQDMVLMRERSALGADGHPSDEPPRPLRNSEG